MVRREHWRCHPPPPSPLISDLPKVACCILPPALTCLPTPARGELAQDLLPGLTGWIFNGVNVQNKKILLFTFWGKGGNGEIRKTLAFSVSGMVRGIWVLLEIRSCKTGGRAHRAVGLWLVTRLDAGSSHHTCRGRVQLIPSLMHAEADTAVGSKGECAAGEGTWLLLRPRATFLLLSPDKP